MDGPADGVGDGRVEPPEERLRGSARSEYLGALENAKGAAEVAGYHGLGAGAAVAVGLRAPMVALAGAAGLQRGRVHFDGFSRSQGGGCHCAGVVFASLPAGTFRRGFLRGNRAGLHGRPCLSLAPLEFESVWKRRCAAWFACLTCN